MDVVVGDAGRDRCVVGVEVYLPAAPSRPQSLADLRVSLEKDHSTTYELTAAPTTVERHGRQTVIATLRNPTNGVNERQWAFFLGRDPFVLSFYATGRLEDCEKLENAVLSTIRTGSCGN